MGRVGDQRKVRKPSIITCFLSNKVKSFVSYTLIPLPPGFGHATNPFASEQVRYVSSDPKVRESADHLQKLNLNFLHVANMIFFILYDS